MPYCKYCGSAVDSDAVFCAKCGKRIKETKSPAPVEHPAEREAITTMHGGTISAEEIMHSDPEKLQAYMDNVVKYRTAMTMLNEFYNTLDEWTEHDFVMWDEAEAAMRKKYDIPEISIYRFLKPERREQVVQERRKNRSYTKKGPAYWAQFEKKDE